MASINNSSTAKFLALFGFHALFLASCRYISNLLTIRTWIVFLCNLSNDKKIKNERFIPVYSKKLMNQLKAVFPFFAAFGNYFLALNSQMYQKLNQPYSVEKEIKSIPVEEFK